MFPNLDESLAAAGLKTFEDLCFMFPAPELEDDFRGQKAEASVQLRLLGDRSGLLSIQVGGDLYSAAAANMLGIAVPDAGQKEDALREITNIIAGNIMPDLVRSFGIRRMDFPRIVQSAAGKRNDPGKQAGSARVVLDRGWIEMAFHLDEPSPLKGAVR
jgi:hypothetical protein